MSVTETPVSGKLRILPRQLPATLEQNREQELEKLQDEEMALVARLTEIALRRSDIYNELKQRETAVRR
jgi:hypothetical protein